MRIFYKNFSFLSPTYRKVAKDLIPAFRTIDVVYQKQLRTVYPNGITKEMITSSLNKKELIGGYSVIKRSSNVLKSVPYQTYFKMQLHSISKILKNISKQVITTNRYFARLCTVIANGITTDDYRSIDNIWLEIKPSDLTLDLSLGAYECYHDKILGEKSFYTAVLKNIQQDETIILQRFVDALLTSNPDSFLPIPCPAKPKRVYIEIADVLMWSGEFEDIEPVGWSRPYKKETYEKHGSKKVIFSNTLAKRVQYSIIPLFKKYFSKELVAEYLPFIKKGYTQIVALHELAHTIGKYPDADKRLGEYQMYVEEARAETLAQVLANALEGKKIISEKERKVLLVLGIVNLIFLFFLAEKNHGRRAYLFLSVYTFNEMVRQGAVYRTKDSLFNIDFQKAERIYRRVADILNLISANGLNREESRALNSITDLKLEMQRFLKQ